MFLCVILPSLMWGVYLSVSDLRERRLPNWATIGGGVVALVSRYGYGGVPLLLDGVAAGAAAAAFLLIPFLMRGAGGGDVKMLFAAGAVVGWSHILFMLLVTSVAGIVMGVVMLLCGTLDGSRLKHAFRGLFDWRYDRVAGAVSLPPKESNKVRIPFSIPITAGMLAALAAVWQP